MTKQQLKQQIKTIATLAPTALTEYEKKLSLSMVNDEARSYLYRAINIKRREEVGRVDTMAVSSIIEEVS